MAVTLVQSPQQRTAASPITFANTTPIINNILVFVGFGGGSYSALTIPAGWNSLVADFRSTSSNALFSQAIWRVADGTEGTAISFAYVSATVASAGILLEFSGAVSTTPTVATSSSAVLGTAETFPATIPANANALAVQIGGNTSATGTVTTPTGYTAIATLTQTTYVPHAFTLANPATGTDCSQPATIGASSAWISYLLLMQPSATATVYTSNLTAGLSFVGASSKFVSRALSAALSFLGSLTPVKSGGATAKFLALTASVGFAGAQTRSTLRSFFASVATIGTQTKALSRSMAASVTFAGVQGRIIPTVLAAVLSFAGDLATFFAKGGLTAIGNREYTAGATGTGKNAPGATGTGDNPGGTVGNEQ